MAEPTKLDHPVSVTTCIRKIRVSNLGRVTNSPGCFRGFPQSLQSCAGKVLLIRPERGAGAQIFGISKSHLKIQGARRLTLRFRIKGPQILRATVQNSAAQASF
jgi:hypothetical protein